MSIKILCIGDIHLGRVSSKLPAQAELEHALTPREALHRCAAAAKRLGVRIIAFTGDTADQSSAHFEAYGALSLFVNELSAYGMRFFAVAGNHDFDMLQRLARTIPEFHVLGADGKWEYQSLEIEGERLILHGKSFTEPHSSQNPLADYVAPPPGVPCLALLHCDLAGDTRYAPVQLSELTTKPPLAWLLGHMHKPKIHTTKPLVFYPGILHPLHPGEDGPHGPWLLEIEGGIARAEMLPLAPLRYESLAISLEGTSSLEEARMRVTSELENWKRNHSSELDHTDVLCLRLTLTGRTRIFAELPRLCSEIEQNSQALLRGMFIERISQECLPKVELKTLALQQDPVGLLARRILILDEKAPPAAYAALLSEGRRRLMAALQIAELACDDDFEDERVHELLRKGAAQALNSLLKQKDPQP